MSEKKNLLERKLQQQETATKRPCDATHCPSPNVDATIRPETVAHTLIGGAIAGSAGAGSKPWPFSREYTSPIAGWRTLPAHLFGDAEHVHLHKTLEAIAALAVKEDFIAAMRGNPAAALRAVLVLIPITAVTLELDIAMTAVLRCALDGDLNASLVLAHLLGRSELHEVTANELAASWFSHHRRAARGRYAYTRQEAALLSKLRDHGSARRGGAA